MSTYIVFERMNVQDANCIAGFTYGFPAITHFLGFGRALSRKLSQSCMQTLKGCAVICHQYQVHAYQPKSYGDYVFAQSKNPPTTKAKATESPPIIEEGKMNMTVSLVMECPGFLLSRESDVEAFKKEIMSLTYQHRLAGGSIQHVEAIHVFNVGEDSQQKIIRKIKRLLLPGFVLMDRSDLLEQHFVKIKEADSNAQLIDAWLDFSAMKYKAAPLLKEGELVPTENTKAEWIRLEKPAKGWLVPITNGYNAITKVYSAGEVKNVRNANYPFCFVEAVHSIGEWRSLHRINCIEDMLWQYCYEQDWYLCKQQVQEVSSNSDVGIDETEMGFDNFFNSL